MSFNEFDDSSPAATRSTTGRRQQYYQQLGAPTLIYEGCRRDHFSFRPGWNKIAIDNATDMHQAINRRNRPKARWQYSLDVHQIDSVLVPGSAYKRKRRKGKGKAKAKTKLVYVAGDRSSESESDSESDERHGTRGGRTLWVDRQQQRNRLAMLLEDDRRLKRHKKCLENYAKYEHPYAKGKLIRRDRKTKTLRMDSETHLTSQQAFRIAHTVDSDPSYLAPFDPDSINEAVNDTGAETTPKGRARGFRRKVPFDDPRERHLQGNALLTIPCPCRSCSRGARGYVLVHAKGDCLERLCVSNIIPPLGQSNAGDVGNEDKRVHMDRNSVASHANEICLDDTILEIRRCGTWRGDNQECLLSVRTGTHVSVVNLRCKRPDWATQQQSDPGTSICCGCYVLREIERLDLRSFSPKLPSFRPVSLASHPRYGNAFAPSRFAFVSHSVGCSGSTSHNVIHSCVVGAERVTTSSHDISNLRSISSIDFSNQNPMCLWSAASSYIRPALAPGCVAKVNKLAKCPFGLGSSLFSIDLRHNSGTFQWSPSAEEMVTEGVHSINGISTDWTRENVVYVTSSSAGKTWEIDGRMPCRAVNTWSLTSICEEYRNITVPQKSFYGEPCLLTRPLPLRGEAYTYSERCRSTDNPDPPLIKVDTDPRANGIHLFQKPLRKPRFQTDSLECIGAAGLDTTDTSSIATSSYFDLTDVSADTFICGVSSIRLPLSQFVGTEENIWSQYLEQELNVLCTLTMDNNGDIYSHSLLECNDKTTIPDNCRRFDGLPIGTRAITIPEEIDGRTKFLANGHWKQTGGMNLNLFLSNVYPAPRGAMITHEHDSNDSNVGKSILFHNSKHKKIDDGAAVIQISEQPCKPGLVISSEDGNGHRNEMIKRDGDHRTLIMPNSHAEGMQKRTMVYAGRNSYDSDDSDGIVGVRTGASESVRRSDLSREIIQNTLEKWEDTASEQESSDESDESDF